MALVIPTTKATLKANIYIRNNVDSVSILENYISSQSFLSIDEISALIINETNTMNALLFAKENCLSYQIMSPDMIECITDIDLIDHIDIVDFIDFIDLIEFPDLATVNSKDLHYSRPSMKSIPGIDSGYISRESIIKMYNITYDTILHNSSIGVIEFKAQGYTQSAIDYNLVYNNLPPNKIRNGTGTNLFADIESLLDLQMVTMVASGAIVYYYNFPLWLADGFNYLNNQEFIPGTLSISYGWAEDAQCQISGCKNQDKSYVDRVNLELLKIATRGTTVVVASGDAGSPSRTNEGCLPQNITRAINAEFPASSPYVLSVGATAVTNDTEHVDFNYTSLFCKEYPCVTHTSSISINYDNVQWTTGGSFSIYSNNRTFQDNVVNDYLKVARVLPGNQSAWNPRGRAVPDIVANGHMCAVFGIVVPDIAFPVDGTSCSCPIIAGIIALVNDQRKGRGLQSLGLFNGALYNLQPSSFVRPRSTNTHCTEVQCCSIEYGFVGSPDVQWDPVVGLGHPVVSNWDVLVEDRTT